MRILLAEMEGITFFINQTLCWVDVFMRIDFQLIITYCAILH